MAIAVVLVVVNIIVFMILAKLVEYDNFIFIYFALVIFIFFSLEKHSTMAGALVSLAQKSGLVSFYIFFLKKIY